MVDAPGRFDLDVVVAGEQGGQPRPLFVGEQVGAGMQGPPGPVERIGRAASMPVQLLLDSAAAQVQRVAGQTDDVEGVHHGDSVRDFLGGGGLEPGEAVHGHDLQPVPPCLGAARPTRL